MSIGQQPQELAASSSPPAQAKALSRRRLRPVRSAWRSSTSTPARTFRRTARHTNSRPRRAKPTLSRYNTAPLAVVEANRNGPKIVGSATNKTGKPVTGPYGAEVYCFAGNKITGQRGDFAEEDGDVEPGGTVHFTVDLYDTPCKIFALGVSGYFS